MMLSSLHLRTYLRSSRMNDSNRCLLVLIFLVLGHMRISVSSDGSTVEEKISHDRENPNSFAAEDKTVGVSSGITTQSPVGQAEDSTDLSNWIPPRDELESDKIQDIMKSQLNQTTNNISLIEASTSLPTSFRVTPTDSSIDSISDQPNSTIDIQTTTVEPITVTNQPADDDPLSALSYALNYEYATSPSQPDMSVSQEGDRSSSNNIGNVILRPYIRGGLTHSTGEGLSRVASNHQKSTNNVQTVDQIQEMADTTISTLADPRMTFRSADQISNQAIRAESESLNAITPKTNQELTRSNSYVDLMNALKLLDQANFEQQRQVGVMPHNPQGQIVESILSNSHQLPQFHQSSDRNQGLDLQSQSVRRSFAPVVSRAIETSPSNRAIQVVISEDSLPNGSSIVLKSTKGKTVKSSLAFSSSPASSIRVKDTEDKRGRISREPSKRLTSKYKSLLSRPPYLGNFDTGIVPQNFPINIIDHSTRTGIPDVKFIKAKAKDTKPNIAKGEIRKDISRDESQSSVAEKTPSPDIFYYSASDGINSDKGFKMLDAIGSKMSQSKQVTKVFYPPEANQSNSVESSPNSNVNTKSVDSSFSDNRIYPGDFIQQPKSTSTSRPDSIEIGQTAKDLTAVKVKKRDQAARINSALPQPPRKVVKNNDDTVKPAVQALTSKILPIQLNPHPSLGYHLDSTIPKKPLSHPMAAFITKDLTLDEIPQPLTFGELARHHGVPFRLKFPIGDSHHDQSLDPLGNTQMIENSNLIPSYRDYETNLSDPNSVDMKKRLVIATIEAMTRNPSLISPLLNLHQARNHLRTTQINNFNEDLDEELYDDLITSGVQPLTDDTDFQIPQVASASSLNGALPVASIRDQIALEEPSQTGHLGPDVVMNSNGVRLVGPEPFYRWALSQMPDLVPIPLSATVPGYLIKLSNGQILAAALTNSLSIQGIQKGPLKPAYKSYLHQRVKNLLRSQGTSQSVADKHIATSDSIHQGFISSPTVNSMAIATGSLHDSSLLDEPLDGSSFVEKPTGGTGGIFSRGFFSHLFGLGKKKDTTSPPGGFEPPTFWLTAKRASRLRHGGSCT